MPASAAQIAANRRNSARSTGPRTAEGKAVSRFNAVRHGLRAESATLPGEDAAHVKGRFVNLHSELRPTNELSESFVDQIALQTIRLERFQRFDIAHYSDRLRHARGDFDAERRALVASLGGRIGFDSDSVRKLQAIPEGVDWMLERWKELRDDLARPQGLIWSLNHLDRARDLREITVSRVRPSREMILGEMVRDFFGNEAMVDVPGGLDDKAKAEWARLELLAIYDAEIARLRDVRAAFDPAALEREYAEFENRLLFDPSKEMTLARKYEAATLRALSKALKDFREAEDAVNARMDIELNGDQIETCDELGSNGNEAEPEPEAPEPEAKPVEKPAPTTDFDPIEPAVEVVRTPEGRKKRPNPAKSRRR